jgi:drug/metabolite transporter (DMT)-like permease
MNARKLVGLTLVVLGVLALAYGGFSYTKKRNVVAIGSVKLGYEKKERVNVPIWAGAAAVLAGAAMLTLGRR